MKIIKDRKVVQNIWKYTFLEHVSKSGQYDISSYEKWLALPSVERHKVLAIALQPEDELDFNQVELFKLTVIAIVFPTFHEGRGYTQANLLRQRGFSGEIRAIGAYRDNLSLLEQCGFNAFDLVAHEDISQALHAFSELDISQTLQ